MTQEARGPRNPVARALRAVLAVQIALAGILVLGNTEFGIALPGLRPDSPELRQPVAPGNQVRLFRPQPPASAPQLLDRLILSRLDGGTWLLEGQIAEGDADRITAQIREAGADTVVLNSPGGSVADALALGRVLRDAGLDTRLRDGDMCLSACPYILAGGVRRSVEAGASVGVHQHAFGENMLLPAFIATREIQRGQGEVMEHLHRMGVDPMVMRHALATPPSEIYVLLREQLVEYRLVTGE